MSEIFSDTPFLIEDIKKNEHVVTRSIDAHGYAPEHNIEDYQHAIDDDTDNVFVGFKDDAGVLAKREKKTNVWWMLAEPLAPQKYRAAILVAFLNSIFKHHGAKKVRFELYQETRKELLKTLPPYLRACRPSAILTAPIFELEHFDPELRGNFYKKIRSVVNQYKASHHVEVVDARAIEKALLHNLVERWHKNRTASDQPFDEYYANCIESDFRGFDSVRAIRSNGAIVALNGGWRIPHSNCFYKALGVHDYSDRALGDVAMVEELSWLKQAGYAEGNFGGGEKNLTNFKRRFGPRSYIQSYEFTVTR